MNSTAPASLIRRLAAFLYDSLLLIALFMLLTAVAVRLNNGEAIEHLAYKFALLPIAWFFFAWFWSKSGQTLGMQAWRIKMTNNEGGLVAFPKALARAMLAPAVFILDLFLKVIPGMDNSAVQQLTNTRIVHIKQH